MALSEEQRLNMKKRREKIRDQAITLFSEQGFEGTTIKQVAEAAEVSFGSVFTYFEDKQQLFYAAVVEPLDDFSAEVLDFNPYAEDLIGELKRTIHHHVHIFAGIKNYLTLVVQVVGQSHRFPEPFEQLDQFHDQLREKICGLIINGQEKGLLIKQDPIPVATLYTSLLIGIRLNNTDSRFNKMWDKYTEPMLQLFGPIKA